MVLKKLKSEMTVWDVRKTTGWNAIDYKWSTWPVYIKEIDEQENRVFASWNGNKPQWFYEHIWSKWRLKNPNH